MIMNIALDVIRNRIDIAKEIADSLGNKRAVCLYGDTGIGKTALARAILETLGYEVLRFNGSFHLEESKIPVQQSTISGKKVALIVDEMDRSLKSNYLLLVKLLFYNTYKVNKKTKKKKISGRKTRIPLVFCCNYIKKFKLKTEFCDKFEVEPLEDLVIEEILLETAREKGIEINEKRIAMLATNCHGDIRSALNNLEFGDVFKKDDFNLYKFVQKFFRSRKKDELLSKYKVGEYGSPVYLPWFVSLLSRNIRGEFNSQICDHAILGAVSKGLHVVPVEMSRLLLSCLSTSRIGKIKFPPKKKKDDE